MRKTQVFLWCRFVEFSLSARKCRLALRLSNVSTADRHGHPSSRDSCEGKDSPPDACLHLPDPSIMIRLVQEGAPSPGGLGCRVAGVECAVGDVTQLNQAARSAETRNPGKKGVIAPMPTITRLFWAFSFPEPFESLFRGASSLASTLGTPGTRCRSSSSRADRQSTDRLPVSRSSLIVSAVG